MRSPRRAALVGALALLASASGSAQTQSPRELCVGMLEAGGFDGRFEVLRELVQVVACNLRGLVTDQTMREAIAPRVRQYAGNCFDESERAYLQQALRSGALQEAQRRSALQTDPGADLEHCTSAFEALRAMPLPDPPR